jgi:hypothetical protein
MKKKAINNIMNNAINKDFIEVFGKLIPNSDMKNEIKLKFNDYLGKLNDKDTKHLAFKELKNFISKNNKKEALDLYLPFLLQYNKNTTASSKEFQLLLLGFTISSLKYDVLGGSKIYSHIIDTLLPYLFVSILKLVY